MKLSVTCFLTGAVILGASLRTTAHKEMRRLGQERRVNGSVLIIAHYGWFDAGRIVTD